MTNYPLIIIAFAVNNLSIYYLINFRKYSRMVTKRKKYYSAVHDCLRAVSQQG